MNEPQPQKRYRLSVFRGSTGVRGAPEPAALLSLEFNNGELRTWATVKTIAIGRSQIARVVSELAAVLARLDKEAERDRLAAADDDGEPLDPA
jgi:hypothetical protein